MSTYILDQVMADLRAVGRPIARERLLSMLDKFWRRARSASPRHEAATMAHPIPTTAPRPTWANRCTDPGART